MQSVWSKLSKQSQSYVVHKDIEYYKKLIPTTTLDLTEPIDIYSEWIDAADYAAKEEERRAQRRPVASSSRARPAGPPSIGSEEE